MTLTCKECDNEVDSCNECGDDFKHGDTIYCDEDGDHFCDRTCMEDSWSKDFESTEIVSDEVRD